MKKMILVILASLLLFGLGAPTNADTYTDKTAFESALIDVMTVDFEGIAGGPGQINAVNINGDEFPGLTLTEGTGASGLFVGIPDSPIQPVGNNDNNFFAADFIPTSPDACLAPDSTGSPVGAIIVDFDNPVGGVGVYFLDVEGGGASVEVFDGPGGTGNSLGILSLGYQGDNSQAFAGVVVSGNNIRSAILDMGGDGDGVGIDDLSFGSIEVGVEIDIKPGSCPNPLNLKSKGVLPVAVLGTEDFDVTMIDLAAIGLSREGVEASVVPLRWAYEDVATPFEGELCDCHTLGPDGYLDLTLKFDVPELVATLELDEVAGETIPLILTGKLKEEFGGTPIRGEDCISVLKETGPKGKK